MSNTETKQFFNVAGRLKDLSTPLVMGIINATPDSFFEGSRRQNGLELAKAAEQMLADGADILDIGGCSTRPGATLADEHEERQRLQTALAAVRKACPDAILSVDTFRPALARMAVEEYGAAIVNDISQGIPPDATDSTPEEEVPEMFRTVSRLQVAYVLTSVQKDMEATLLTFARQTRQLYAMGQKDIILDPGFGFGKTLEENFAMLDNMEKLSVFGLPVLAGVSRKSMITRLLGITADQALNGTTALNMAALMKGARILRVHDVRQARECVQLYNTLNRHSA